MVRAELIRKIHQEYPHLYKEDVEAAVLSIFENIIGALEDGGRVELRGYFAFDTKLQAPRLGRNPRNGDKVQVPAKTVLTFRCGKELHSRLNPES
jgi:integration host factor subunit beta